MYWLLIRIRNCRGVKWKKTKMTFSLILPTGFAKSLIFQASSTTHNIVCRKQHLLASPTSLNSLVTMVVFWIADGGSISISFLDFAHHCRSWWIFLISTPPPPSPPNHSQDTHEKLSDVLPLRLRAPFIDCLYFICERKFYARTHVKIMRQWKSTLTKQTIFMTSLD